ncbi:Crp/Fnr family transcriptional regulator [Chryseobacterium wangxinyae]|uniref:Crp/Fnr family transcriptional regulator n=1 Tax=Chryseobacterium sp. CY350 TaxID=2997336 RepID=UPI00227093CD|nr:Crp/Fnr family transcriptional regulator [Chryseobacterium sp. CY350]MCY0976926.1 Crp/Fnr family transcriptional regulator [Chryseobacterium sp. CY350]WBZ96926.1 Crp/Fnr family transcriptional regulator [Chryseobacterium sp. CY350]
MSIKEDLLHSAGATEENYKTGDYIFHESTSALFYYQVVTGEVKLNNYNTDGKEFIQNIHSAEAALGVSMLFLEKSYPMNAVAINNCTILKLRRTDFFKLLELHPKLYNDVCKSLSDRLYKKYVVMKAISCHNAAERLKEVMRLMKLEQPNQLPYTFEVPLTRQQLASLTGLCLETTIRTIKKMEKENVLRIHNRKILF